LRFYTVPVVAISELWRLFLPPFLKPKSVFKRGRQQVRRKILRVILPPMQMTDARDVRSVHDDGEEWAGDFDPLADKEEQRVLFATLDSFRYAARRPLTG
jgi:hypothetical protein